MKYLYLLFIQILKKDEKIQKLLEDISIQLEDYQALQQTKTALDMEIAVYKRLLESEEDRFGIDRVISQNPDSESVFRSLFLGLQAGPAVLQPTRAYPGRCR